ncbi:zinc-dependent alcohol dehydrogenase [Pseudoflavonifractor capillosus]|uniref:zinc-dependent alcohol dehydrogenase n=1 Tax=Pseudoflavonifractor capillosus TaxID=106588 RepID=UPI00195A8C46|nr:alcohol dehydrogenase catalytic domain-containing protein [Pseudoflavonifractor capillosus]MBM6679851.1 alcohol dehydrogenase catalytic domain-containing protein [Pseudoflavonifractor capillosus]MBS6348129.1 alcohol dehydrogenase catalytic domain-containing protein [Oscillospiraceae bacterium]
MKETMKEVVITGPKQYEIREVPVPKPGDGEVLIQMKAAGVCGSDVHQFLGENPNAVFPRVPGHENAGVIVAVGKDVKNIKVGDHVVVDLVVACGECPQCKKGRRNVCRTVKARGSAIDGGWREYFAVPEHEVYLLPQDMPFKDAALIEPFAIGGHCTTRAGIQGGESVLVLGSGTIGAVILQTLKLKGCRVICADINDASLARAKEYGADAIVNTKTENLKDAVQKFTDGAGVDVIFDSACYPGSLTAVLEMGIPANGATIVPMGFCTAQEGITQAMINTRELSIIGTRMSCNQFQPTIERFAKHEYQLDGMVSHYIPFSQVGQVFENIIHPPKDMKKMVIVFDEE